MATQTIEFRAVTSQTITARIFAIGNDTQIATAAATEATNRKGTYLAAFTDLPAGEYQLIATIGTSPVVPVASWYVTLTLTTATFQVYDKAAAVNLSEVVVDNAAIATASAAAILATPANKLATNDSGEVVASNFTPTDISALETKTEADARQTELLESINEVSTTIERTDGPLDRILRKFDGIDKLIKWIRQ